VAASVPHFVSLEVRDIDMLCRVRMFASRRHGALITVLRMEVVIYMAVKFSRAMKPWASSNKNAPIEPFRTVIAVGRTVIRGNVVITIWTLGGYSDVDADLGLCCGRAGCEADPNHSSYQQKCKSAHKFFFLQ